MGPGDHPFARFGHNAVLLEWPAGEGRGSRAEVYNFGTFKFEGLGGVRDFMAGRFRYWLSVTTLSETLRVYAQQKRSLVAQELELTPNERSHLAEALAENARPEHRFYDYDYFQDNCSTRVRDALDGLLGGELRRSLTGPGRLSFRAHALRLTEGTLWLSGGLDLALGAPSDRPTTRWQELFLPSELHDALAATSRQIAGRASPLVRRERSLLRANRPTPSATPKDRRAGFAGAGLLVGALLAGLGRFGARYRGARIALGALCSSVGLLLGALGAVFAGFWLFSRHGSAHQNLNLLLCPPWALLLVPLGWGIAQGHARRTRQAQQLTWLSVGSGLVALAAALVPGWGQDNARMVALLLPAWGGLLLGLQRVTPTLSPLSGQAHDQDRAPPRASR